MSPEFPRGDDISSHFEELKKSGDPLDLIRNQINSVDKELLFVFNALLHQQKYLPDQNGETSGSEVLIVHGLEEQPLTTDELLLKRVLKRRFRLVLSVAKIKYKRYGEVKSEEEQQPPQDPLNEALILAPNPHVMVPLTIDIGKINDKYGPEIEEGLVSQAALRVPIAEEDEIALGVQHPEREIDIVKRLKENALQENLKHITPHEIEIYWRYIFKVSRAAQVIEILRLYRIDTFGLSNTTRE